MSTVAEASTDRNPKAYHCTYLGLSGILVKPAAAVLFLEPERGAVVTLSAEDVLRDVVINGEVGETMRAYVADLAAGGYAKRACAREEGVQ
jgi:hypothetical protein